ncbi:hypothetical protein MTO96_018277 [Rhipicephalus appendiculatus]
MSEDKEVKPVHGMFAVPAPPTFDFDRTSEWPSWMVAFLVRVAFQRTRPQSYRPLTPSSCPNCGQGEHPRTSCPARAAKCNYCGCSGHFAVLCRKKAAGERKKVQLSSLNMDKGGVFRRRGKWGAL